MTALAARYVIGRLLQVFGLATALIGLYVGVSVSNARAELIYLGVGVAIFYAGVVLQGRNKE